MPKYPISNEKLLAWYEQFKKEVREKASIDVNQIEDVGRIKNFGFREWGSLDDEEQYESALVGESTYAFMPHQDGVCLAVPPKNVTYTDYKVWLQTNLTTDINIDHIRQLYDMSRDGTLMIMQPGVGAENFQQVYTDENGVISTSKPALSYAGESSKAKNKGQTNWLNMPKFVPKPKLKDFGLPEEPVLPPRLKNPNPGFWSWVGYKLGFDTDFAKLERYNKAMNDYDAAKSAWNKRVNGPEGEKFREAQALRAKFVSDMQQYRARPLAIMQGIARGYQDYTTNRTRDEEDMPREQHYRMVMINEDADLEQEHYKTPLGKLNKGVEILTNQLNNTVKRTAKAITTLLSTSSAGDMLDAWREKGVFKHDEYNPVKYLLPPCPLVDSNKKLWELTPQETDIRNAWRQDMDKLSGLACFAALAEPEIIGEPAKENYSKLLSSLFTVGLPNSKDQLDYLAPAREKGMKALAEYVDGRPENLAKMLSNCLRRLNQELTDKRDLRDEHTVNTLFLVDHLMKTLDAKNDLWNMVDLDMEDIMDIGEYRALFDVIRKGKEARVDLAKHATYKAELSPEQVKEAITNILFADTIINGYAEGLELVLTDPDAVEAAKQNLIAERNVDKVASMNREDLGRLNLNLLDFINAFPAKKQPTAAQQEISMEKRIENNLEKNSNQQVKI